MGSNNLFRKLIYYISYAPTMQIFTSHLGNPTEMLLMEKQSCIYKDLNPIVMCAGQYFAKTIAHAIKLSLFYSVARL